jgi:hypothetical protein
MRADDWIYAGEGNNSIAIANNDVHVDGDFYGCLLIIPKLCRDGLHDRVLPLNIGHYVQYIENVMRPWFTSSYVSDRMELIELDDVFLSEIASRIVDHRPLGRLKCDTPLILSSSACVQRNFNVIYRMRPPIGNEGIRYTNTLNTYLSIELKVKSGLKGTSPFIPESRSIKRRFSKFFLTQLHKKSRVSSLGTDQSWGIFVEESTYDPALLFSGNYNNVKSSLCRLFKVPQNNLKVKVNNKHLYGLDKVDMNHLLEGLSSLHVSPTVTSNSNNSDAGVLDIIIDCLSSVLSEECILPRLEAMLKLDLLDVEGCEVVYNRLLQLFKGSHVELETYLLECFSSPLDGTIIEFMRRFDQSRLPKECPSSGLQLPGIIVELASCQVDDSMPIETIQVLHYTALGLIEKETSIGHLALLLKMWMMSLIAKDVSLMVTLQPVVVSRATDNTNTKEPMNQVGKRMQLQDSLSCGVVFPIGVVDSRPGDPLMMFFYSVGILDIGLKPISKIWSKNKVEEAFCSQCIRLLEIVD